MGKSLVAATLTSIEKIAGELGIQLGPHTELSSRQGSGEALRLNISGKGSLSSLSRFAEQLEAAPQPIVLRRLEFQRDSVALGHAELTIHLGVLETQLLPEGGASDA